MLLKKYPSACHVRFSDDTLSSSCAWFREFTEKYAQQIKLPYSTNERAEFITEEKARLYRQGGCISLDIGIESGNAHIRNIIMNRKVSNDVIARAFRLLQEKGIKVNAFNILGMPHETIDSVLDTIKLNAQCNPVLTFNAYFHPYISTDAYRLSKDLGLLGDTFQLPMTLAENPVLKLPTISCGDLKFFHKFFAVLVYLYRMTGCRGIAKNKMTCWLDRFLASRFLPRGLLGRLYVTKNEVKKKFPLLSLALIKIKRKMSSSYIN